MPAALSLSVLGEPERCLWLAVVASAMDDLERGSPAERLEAWAWFSSPFRRDLWAVCDLAGLDVGAVQARASRLAARAGVLGQGPLPKNAPAGECVRSARLTSMAASSAVPTVR